MVRQDFFIFTVSHNGTHRQVNDPVLSSIVQVRIFNIINDLAVRQNNDQKIYLEILQFKEIYQQPTYNFFTEDTIPFFLFQIRNDILLNLQQSYVLLKDIYFMYFNF